MDRWLPPGVHDGIDRQRLRIGAAFLQILGLLALFFGVLDAANGHHLLSLTSFGGFVLAGALLWRMHRGADPERLAWWSSATIFVVLVGNACLNGGLEAPALHLWPLIPTFPLLLDARRPARFWLATCIVLVVGLYLVEVRLGRPFPEAMSTEEVTVNRVLVVVAGFLVFVGAFSLNSAFGRWMQNRLLEAESERFDQILDAAGDAIVRVGSTGQISSLNAAARSLFCAPELEGVAIRDLLPGLPEDGGTERAVVLQARSGEDWIPVEATTTALPDGWVLVIRDIRERVRAEQEMQQALADARAASVAKSRFLASMSHELRTPLNAVIGYAEMVAEDIEAGEPPEDTTDLQHIVGSARHLLALIDQVLDLAKVEAGRMEVELRKVPLQSFLVELDTVGRTLARTHANRWSSDLPEEDCVVWLDEVRVRQIVLNLLSNAGKFCERGGISFEARYAAGRLQLTVADTGIGMSEKELASVWEEFVQADETIQRRYGGTGLGLPLVRRLTELLGGTITVESVPGEGTRFDLDLPVERVESPQV